MPDKFILPLWSDTTRRDAGLSALEDFIFEWTPERSSEEFRANLTKAFEEVLREKTAELEEVVKILNELIERYKLDADCDPYSTAYEKGYSQGFDHAADLLKDAITKINDLEK